MAWTIALPVFACHVLVFLCLLVGPFGLFLLRKSGHPNRLILGPEQSVEYPPLKLDAVPDAELLALVDDLLAGLDGNLAVAGNLLGRGEGSVDTLLGFVKDSCGEPPFACLLRGDVVAGEYDFHGPALADGAGQPLAAAASWDGAQLDFGLAKSGLGTSIHDVAHHGELAAAAEGVAIDGHDQGLLEESHELGPVLDEVIAVGGAKGQVLHLLDVCTGGEGALGAGEDDGANGLVGLVVAEGGVELEDEGRAEGIEGLGAVQLDCGGSAMQRRVLAWKASALKPTPGLGDETSRCSYVVDDE